MSDASPAAIAARFLPNRPHYYYARIKLATDPIYDGVAGALDGCRAPLLDLGCGIGLFAHMLRRHGIRVPYHGVDNDARKIAAAREAATRSGLDATFETVDLAREAPPAHHGSVSLLDVLQFVPPDTHAGIVGAAIDRLAPEGRLVIRTGLQRETVRLRVTRAVDVFSRWWGWMNAGPQRYPSRAALEGWFEARGLEARFEPLRGRTPFENWLVVATHRGGRA
ncbi:class I SAM-dependent methyltransferase [Dokdonella sp. MW10]|uniref:class I SAM-dependent methyltransferase n=1 Tax=Dokdonella sp. MW10 TaxID=2992926 RepID=UPI003F806644